MRKVGSSLQLLEVRDLIPDAQCWRLEVYRLQKHSKKCPENRKGGYEEQGSP
jgi:hypothetical protein